MNIHSFDVTIATKYGVPVAIVLNHIAFWIQKNKANEKHFHDGRYWTYNSIKAFQELFPYWTFKQMRSVLDKLKESGLILTGNFNQIGYDQTQWYGLSDEGLKLYNMAPSEPISEAICPKGQIDLSKRANRFDQKGKPIPDIKPDIKPDKSFCPSDNLRAENAKRHGWANKKPNDSPMASVENQSTSYNPNPERSKKVSPILEAYMNRKVKNDTDDANKSSTRTKIQSKISRRTNPGEQGASNDVERISTIPSDVRSADRLLEACSARVYLEKIGMANSEGESRHAPWREGHARTAL